MVGHTPAISLCFPFILRTFWSSLLWHPIPSFLVQMWKRMDRMYAKLIIRNLSNKSPSNHFLFEVCALKTDFHHIFRHTHIYTTHTHKHAKWINFQLNESHTQWKNNLKRKKKSSSLIFLPTWRHVQFCVEFFPSFLIIFLFILLFLLVLLLFYVFMCVLMPSAIVVLLFVCMFAISFIRVENPKCKRT
jgi:hypothetical protein